MMLSDTFDLSSGIPVLIAANLGLLCALDVPFEELGGFAVVLDTAVIFAVELRPIKVYFDVLGFP